MTNDTTPALEGVTPEQVAAILKDVTLAVSTDGTGTIYIMPELTPDSAVAIAARDKDMGWHKANPEIFEAMVDRFNAHEALAADLAAQTERADAMRRSYDELYADALADARSDAQEFEGDLWKLLRDYLTELNLDWYDYTEDGITAEQAIEHIRDAMDGETARADAAERELHGPISDLTGADITNIIAHLSLELEPRGPLPTRNSVMMALIATQNDLAAAEAKVARLVEVLIWTDMELAKLSGLWYDVSPRKQIRAIIAEVQG